MIGANIGKFLSDVAALSETKKTQDIVDISNQSSKEGIRIVIELRKDADAENFVNMLYKKTRLEDTFGVNMLAIYNGRPETMGLKSIIKACVDFQYETATRKYTNLLAKEMEKKEIQEGLIKACNVIDLVIEILRGSRDRNMAKACLVEGKTDGIKFKSKESAIMAAQLSFTEKQANAILEMRLYKLIGLELEALIKEHEDTMANIYRYEDILDRRETMAQVIMNELDDYKKEFSRKRRTVIENGEADPGVYLLSRISKQYGIALDVLLYGEEPRMNGYFVTRRGQGLEVDRHNDYKYKSLASGFKGRVMEPFFTEIEPLPDGKNHAKNVHDGQEFIIVFDGVLEVTIEDKVIVLRQGDSIYFDTTRPHCMRALENQTVKFLTVII